MKCDPLSVRGDCDQGVAFAVLEGAVRKPLCGGGISVGACSSKGGIKRGWVAGGELP
jgi:hypothetical protein